MSALTRSFRSAATYACRAQGFPFNDFLTKWGLDAILIDADASNYSAKELAAHVLVGCCVTGGKFNNFQVGLLAVLRFLNVQFGSANLSQVQMFRDGCIPEKCSREGFLR